MLYWNSDEFKKISNINSENRMSSNNGKGPSLHTGGSVAFAEYKRRHKEITGEELRDDELFLKYHQTKDEKKWICGKPKRIWNKFIGIVKENLGDTSASLDEDDQEIDGEDIERGITTNEDEGENSAEQNILNLLKKILDEQIAKAWMETVGGAKKGRVYGVGSAGGSFSQVNCAASSASTCPVVSSQQVVDSPEFKQLLDQALEQRMTDMRANIRASIQEDLGPVVEFAVRLVMGRLLFPSQASPNGLGSTQSPP